MEFTHLDKKHSPTMVDVSAKAATAASAAALTIYDMCKSASKEIVIEATRLVEKTGGKSDFSKK